MTDRLSEILHKPGELRRQSNELRERCSALRCSCQSTTARYGGCSGGPGTGGPRDTTWAALADADEKLRRCRKELEEAEARLNRLLKKLKSAFPENGHRDHDLLWNRYMLGRTWLDTQKALAAAGHKDPTLRTVYNWHRAALERCEELLSAERTEV